MSNSDIINLGSFPGHCWCPMCTQADQPRAFHWALWISPAGDEVVCVYSLCTICLNRMISASGHTRIELNDRIEVNLLRRYPQLRAKLLSFFRHSAN